MGIQPTQPGWIEEPQLHRADLITKIGSKQEESPPLDEGGGLFV